MTRENKFIGILFECCNIYRRIYMNKEKNAYEGKCPNAMERLRWRLDQAERRHVFFRHA